MPGRNPSEAVAAFLAPIQAAASVLGSCKVTGSRGCRGARPGDDHHWALGDGDGLELRNQAGVSPGRRHFYAAMSWRLIEDDRDRFGPYRVTSTRYDYSLTLENDELWALHWHPEGRSAVTYPHQHLGSRLLGPSALMSSKAHLPTGRMSFESAVRWAIESGAAPVCPNWEERLRMSETPHLLFRTWTQNRDTEAPPKGIGGRDDVQPPEHDGGGRELMTSRGRARRAFRTLGTFIFGRCYSTAPDRLRPSALESLGANTGPGTLPRSNLNVDRPARSFGSSFNWYSCRASSIAIRASGFLTLSCATSCLGPLSRHLCGALGISVNEGRLIPIPPMGWATVA